MNKPNYVTDSKSLGHGMRGATYNGESFVSGKKFINLPVIERSRLRRAFGNSQAVLKFNGTLALAASSQGKAKTTPFRVAYNAGDPAGTVNQYTSTKYGRASNQITRGSLGRLSGLRLGDGARQTTSNEGAAWSGNVKFVYDSSDYTRYKNLRANNRNYNDYNLGGSRVPNSTEFIALNRVR